MSFVTNLLKYRENKNIDIHTQFFMFSSWIIVFIDANRFVLLFWFLVFSLISWYFSRYFVIYFSCIVICHIIFVLWQFDIVLICLDSFNIFCHSLFVVLRKYANSSIDQLYGIPKNNTSTFVLLGLFKQNFMNYWFQFQRIWYIVMKFIGYRENI